MWQMVPLMGVLACGLVLVALTAALVVICRLTAEAASARGGQ